MKMAAMGAAVACVWETLRGVREPELRQAMVAIEMGKDVAFHGRLD